MILGITASSISRGKSGATITNYVFDGDTDAYMYDASGTPTMLDSIVNQTLIIRVKRTINTHDHGFLGTEDQINSIKIEVDANDNKMDVSLADTGASTFTNGTVSTDLGWHVYALTYTSTVTGLTAYEDGTLIKATADLEFVGRTSGRIFTVGSVNVSGTGKFLKGEVSDVQFYNRELTSTEVSNLATDLTDYPTDHATSLKANFAGNKTSTTWTSEVNSHVLTSKGGVTTN